MKKIILFLIIANYISITKNSGQSLKKVFEMPSIHSGDDEIQIHQLNDGIVIEKKGPSANSANFLGTSGAIITRMKSGEKFLSDSSRVYVVRIANGCFDIDMYIKKGGTPNKTRIHSAKSIQKIMNKDGVILHSADEDNDGITKTVENAFLLGNKLMIKVKFDLGANYNYSAYFMMSLENPADVYKINPVFPELNDDAPAQKRYWHLVTHDQSRGLFIFSRTYTLAEGNDQGQNALTVAVFNNNFKLVKTFDVHQKYNFDASIGYLAFNLSYEKFAGWFFIDGFMRMEDKKKNYEYCYLLQVYDVTGKLVWKHAELNPLFENCSSFLESAESHFDLPENNYSFKFNYAMNRYGYFFNTQNGELIRKEKKNTFLSKKEAVSNNPPLDDEIKTMMNSGSYKEAKIYKFDKITFVLFVNKENKYFVYSK